MLSYHKTLSHSPKDGYYTWIYEGSKNTRNMYLTMVIAIFLFLVMFPIWPRSMKIGAWYCSVTLLLLMVGMLSIRLVVFLVLYPFGIDIWLFPNILRDEIPLSEIFSPIISVETAEKSEWPYRLAAMFSLAAVYYYVANAPNQYTEYLDAAKSFTADIYEGNLLSDRSQTAKDNIDMPKFPTMADLVSHLFIPMYSNIASNSVPPVLCV